MLNIYWIHLQDNYDREAAFHAMMRRNPAIFGAGENVHCIEAVDGRMWTDYENNLAEYIDFHDADGNFSAPRTGFPQYACFLSHINALQQFCKSTSTVSDVALILEDDMTDDFINTTYWQQRIHGGGDGGGDGCWENWIKNAPQDWEILQLCYISTPGERPVPLEYERILPNNENCLYSTGAYLIRRHAAANILQKFIGIETIV